MLNIIVTLVQVFTLQKFVSMAFVSSQSISNMYISVIRMSFGLRNWHYFMTHKTQSIKGFMYAYGLISHICQLAIDIQKWYFCP